MVGLFGEQIERGLVFDVSPMDVAGEEVLADRLDGSEELALLYGEGADPEAYGRAFLEQQQGFEEC